MIHLEIEGIKRQLSVSNRETVTHPDKNKPLYFEIQEGLIRKLSEKIFAKFDEAGIERPMLLSVDFAQHEIAFKFFQDILPPEALMNYMKAVATLLDFKIVPVRGV